MGCKTNSWKLFEQSCLRYDKVNTFSLVYFYCLGTKFKTRGFTVHLSLQQDYFKLAQTLTVTMQAWYLHCFCTGLAELTSYHVFAVTAHRSMFSWLIWLHGLHKTKNKRKTLKLVTTQLRQNQISRSQLCLCQPLKSLPMKYNNSNKHYTNVLIRSK